MIAMTKAIVVYNSRTGNTEKIAKQIAEGLSADYRNINNVPNLKDYDLVVVGSWVFAGRISFAGARLIRKLHRKNLAGKKVALFFTGGSPEEVNPMSEHSESPKLVKDTMFESMEKRLLKGKNVTILPERFCCMGAVRMRKKGPIKGSEGHPNDEELKAAKAFGKQLSKL
jgi:hypothetical protein